MSIITKGEFLAEKKFLHRFIDENCIERTNILPGKIPGTHYIWMLYLRRCLFRPEYLTSVAKIFLYKMQDLYPTFDFQISGRETAATPMLAGIPMVAKGYGIDINAFVVRKEPKTYGMKNKIEGIPNNKQVVMLDDLCNSGDSLKLCRDVLIDEQIPIAETAFVILNKSLKEVHSKERQETDMWMPKDIKVISIYNLNDFDLKDPSH